MTDFGCLRTFRSPVWEVFGVKEKHYVRRQNRAANTTICEQRIWTHRSYRKTVKAREVKIKGYYSWV